MFLPLHSGTLFICLRVKIVVDAVGYRRISKGCQARFYNVAHCFLNDFDFMFLLVDPDFGHRGMKMMRKEKVKNDWKNFYDFE